jgi:hypothetical protein
MVASNKEANVRFGWLADLCTFELADTSINPTFTHHVRAALPKSASVEVVMPF